VVERHDLQDDDEVSVMVPYERRLVVCCIVCETMKCIRSSEEGTRKGGCLVEGRRIESTLKLRNKKAGASSRTVCMFK
jgi:hypothetical protein